MPRPPVPLDRARIIGAPLSTAGEAVRLPNGRKNMFFTPCIDMCISYVGFRLAVRFAVEYSDDFASICSAYSEDSLILLGPWHEARRSVESMLIHIAIQEHAVGQPSTSIVFRHKRCLSRSRL